LDEFFAPPEKIGIKLMNFISYLKPIVIMGQLKCSFLWPFNPLTEVAISIRREWSKKIVQQGRESLVKSRRAPMAWYVSEGVPLVLGARSIRLVREHRKKARTPLAAFFNIPIIKQTFKGTL
jgi:hypothetical protein